LRAAALARGFGFAAPVAGRAGRVVFFLTTGLVFDILFCVSKISLAEIIVQVIGRLKTPRSIVSALYHK
jgi:hypothetical protein